MQERNLQIASGVIAPVYKSAVKGGRNFAQFKSALYDALVLSDPRWRENSLSDKDVITRLRGLERAAVAQYKAAGKTPPKFPTLPGTPQGGKRGRAGFDFLAEFDDLATNGEDGEEGEDGEDSASGAVPV